MTSLLALLVLSADPSFCAETPTAAPGASHGRPSRGSVDGAVALAESAAVRVLPHDDHFHLRIRCTAAERKADCRD